jgi:DNA-binding NtrC family response regulator
MGTIDHSQMKLVVIDDDAMVLKAIEAALQDMGFASKVFDNPRKAIDWVRTNGADIVISDICMPEYDGFQVLKHVKETDPQCDVIFITAHGQLDIAIRALREGATDFFEKPLTSSALQAAIERTRRFRVLVQQQSVLANQVSALSGELLYRTSSKNVMLGRSPAMEKVASDIVDIAASSATVLVLGESGTGKELVANAIHMSSARKSKPFLTLNCPSVPEDLFESEMFGHRRGAFTGAVETRGGYVEAAQGGTLFLDEIGDMPLKSQSKILRLLEQKTYLPVGENKEKEADVRIIAATNQALDSLVKEKKFREDLFYRLNVCTVRLPPLRDRPDDIPLLALYFVMQFAAEMAKPIDGLEDEALRILAAHDYPGNVRELRNIIESSVIHCRHHGLLKSEDLPGLPDTQRTTGESRKWPVETIKFQDVERELYREALRRANNNVSEAARLLGLSRGKLRRRLAALDMVSDTH